MSKILVTGGCGYIGSHTIVDLIENGYEVISIDDNSRSTEYLLDGIEKITGKKVKNYKVDLKSFDDLKTILRSERFKDKRKNDGLPFVNDEMLKRISQLKSDLGKYKLTLPECRRLLELKHNSNMTFHGNRNDNLVKVIQDFKKIQFPNNLLAYQTPLNKIRRPNEE